MSDSSKKERLGNKVKLLQRIIVFIAVLSYLSTYIPVPYFIAAPGMAIKLNPMIKVENGYKEKGDFMLTTISMGQGNLGYYIYSQFMPNVEYVPKENVLSEDEDPEQYESRQLQIMKHSQDEAVIAAFRQVNIPIEVKYEGIIVSGLIEGMPAMEILQTGDLITKVDHHPVYQLKDLSDILVKKKQGDEIAITFKRNLTTLTKHVKLVRLNTQEDSTSPRVGLGFYPEEERIVVPSRQVSIQTDDIGGPSAGFMFTLEIMNQLLEEDLTRGYEIAGTGTINSDGKVGQIGGARLKVHAASEAGAEIFFVPKDIQREDTNQKEVEVENQTLEHPMKVVPIANLDEAFQFLQTLPKKK